MVDILKADGLDKAILGQCCESDRIIYSLEWIIDILVERDGMTPEEAREFFDYNIVGAYVGEGTPIYMENYNDEQHS